MRIGTHRTHEGVEGAADQGRPGSLEFLQQDSLFAAGLRGDPLKADQQAAIEEVGRRRRDAHAGEDGGSLVGVGGSDAG